MPRLSVFYIGNENIKIYDGRLQTRSVGKLRTHIRIERIAGVTPGRRLRI